MVHCLSTTLFPIWLDKAFRRWIGRTRQKYHDLQFLGHFAVAGASGFPWAV
jgi:hypothetical protein